MEHECFEICVFNSCEDDYVVAKISADPNEAIMYLKGLAELGLESCIRYYSWTE